MYSPQLLVHLRLPRPPASTLFPYTTLFRSRRESDRIRALALGADDCLLKPFAPQELVLRVGAILRRLSSPAVDGPDAGRSEEHTSELQSPYDLVCRLLLEKKKERHNNT